MEWTPPMLVKEGMHHHIPRDARIEVYRRVAELIEEAWAGAVHMPKVALCKEPVGVRRATGLLHDDCNCGP